MGRVFQRMYVRFDDYELKTVKVALMFGLAWYRKLPGIFEFVENPKVEDIITCDINHEEVERAYNTLMSKAYVGVLECGSENTIPGYTNEKNNEYLFEALKKILLLIAQA